MGILKDTYIVNHIDTTPMYARNIILNEQNKILKENAEKDIKARDRVNITLEEYERLKKENKDIKELLNIYQEFYTKFGKMLHLEPKKILNSKLVKVERRNSMESLNDLLHIVFEINPEEVI